MSSPEDPDAAYDRRISVSLRYPTPASAAIVRESLAVEVGELEDERATADVGGEGRTVTVTVRAADTVALRAGFNSWLRLISVAESALGAVDGSSRVAISDPNE